MDGKSTLSRTFIVMSVWVDASALNSRETMASRESRFIFLISPQSSGGLLIKFKLGGLDSLDSDEDSYFAAAESFSSFLATFIEDDSFSLSAGDSSRCLEKVEELL